MRKLLTALMVPSVLLISACGGSTTTPATSDSASTSPSTSEGATATGDLDSVTVDGKFGDAPQVSYDMGLSVDQTESKVIIPGDGETLAEGDTANINYVGMLGSNSQKFDSSYDRGQVFAATLAPQSLIPGFVKGLVGQKVNSRVLIAIPPADGYGAQGNPQAGISGEDTLIFVVDIISRVPSADELPKSAEGKKLELPSSLPRLQFDKDGFPTQFTSGDKTGAAPKNLVAAVAIEGDGPKVEAGQTLIAHYVGQIYPDGTVFDSSWTRGEPANFGIGTGTVVPCWDKGLVGKTVGSRVILVCPPVEGFGEQGNPDAGIKGTDTIIFAVDILGAA